VPLGSDATISEAAAAAGLSIDTLRYYERAGLMLEPPERAASNHRRYGERDVRWIVFLTKLRRTGMPIRRVREYADLIRAGHGNEGERLALLAAHRRSVLAEMKETERNLEEIDRKIAEYGDRIVGLENSLAPHPEPHLTDRVVAITGASSGIGEATAVACARAGAAVALGARRENRLRALVREIESDAGQAIAVSVDVAREEQAGAFIRMAHETFGRLDALINNAGVMLLGPFEDSDVDDWRRMIDVNVMGMLHCTHAALPLMRAQGAGHIVNVSSVAGRPARAGSGVYNLTKFGICGFSESLRQEVTGDGIRVTVLEPGAVQTELVGHNPAAVQQRMEQRFAGVRQLDPEDAARTIVFALAEPQHVMLGEVLIRPTAPTD